MEGLAQSPPSTESPPPKKPQGSSPTSLLLPGPAVGVLPEARLPPPREAGNARDCSHWWPLPRSLPFQCSLHGGIARLSIPGGPPLPPAVVGWGGGALLNGAIGIENYSQMVFLKEEIPHYPLKFPLIGLFGPADLSPGPFCRSDLSVFLASYLLGEGMGRKTLRSLIFIDFAPKICAGSSQAGFGPRLDQLAHAEGCG